MGPTALKLSHLQTSDLYIQYVNEPPVLLDCPFMPLKPYSSDFTQLKTFVIQVRLEVAPDAAALVFASISASSCLICVFLSAAHTFN